MRKIRQAILVVNCILVLLSPFALSRAQAQDAVSTHAMTNSDVIRSKQLGDTDAQIIASIKHRRTAFSFDESSRQALQRAGISMQVQMAMYQSTGNTKTPPSGSNNDPTLPSREVTSAPNRESADSGTSQPAALTETQLQQLATVKPPSGCSSVPSLKNAFPLEDVGQPSSTMMKPDSIPAGWTKLNPRGSGGEIYTKSRVYVGYINRLRYSASLSGTTSLTPMPTIPTELFPTVAPPTQKPPSKPTNPTPSRGGIDEQIQDHFNSFNTCLFNDVQPEIIEFQSRLAAAEIILNGTTSAIKSHLDNLPSVVNTPDEARSAADLSIFPRKAIPPFPIGTIIQLRGLLSQFTLVYPQFSDWAQSNSQNRNAYEMTLALGDTLTSVLDHYLVKSGGDTSRGNTGTNGASVVERPSPTASSPQNQNPSPTNSTDTTKDGNSTTPDTNAKSKPTGTTTTNGNVGSSVPSTLRVGGSEVLDYEANRTFVQSWLVQFKTVAGANDLYFVSDYKPACGGYFGQGTTTQMQLTTVDNWDKSQSALQANLDKVVCESAVTMTSGLGLSFIPDRTPAFVPGVQKDAQGNPVLDSNKNPVIVQTLGYSSTASVRPAYDLQANAAIWTSRRASCEFHLGVGAMLTAATGGATTDITIGPALSMKRRAVFITPVYDIGLRTDLQKGFAVGMPQGNLTSPPTAQTWKSGFGLTITFPFNSGSKTDTSSSGNPSQASSVANPGGGTATGATKPSSGTK